MAQKPKVVVITSIKSKAQFKTSVDEDLLRQWDKLQVLALERGVKISIDEHIEQFLRDGIAEICDLWDLAESDLGVNRSASQVRGAKKKAVSTEPVVEQVLKPLLESPAGSDEIFEEIIQRH